MSSIIIPRKWTQQPQDLEQLNFQYENIKNLVCFYSFGGGIRNNRSPRGENNLSINGTVGIEAIQQGLTAKFSSAGRLETALSEYLRTLPAITMTVWARFNSFTPAYNTVISKRGLNNYCDIHVKSNGKLALYVAATSGVSYDGTGAYALTAGQLYHLTLTYDSVQGLIGYVNGVVDGSASPNGALAATDGSTPRLCIGNDSAFSGRDIAGNVLDVRVFDRALSASEIKREYIDGLWNIFHKKSQILYFDAGGGIITKTASDALTASLTEAQGSFLSSLIFDAVTPSIGETIALLKNPEFVSVTDSLNVSISEAISLLSQSIVSDTFTVSVTDLASVNTGGAINISVSDAFSPSLTETQESVIYAAVLDALTIALGEQQGSLIYSAVTDVIPFSITDNASLLVAHTATDTFVISLIDSSVVDAISVTAKNVFDALTPYFDIVAIYESVGIWANKTSSGTIWTYEDNEITAWSNKNEQSTDWTDI